MSFSKIMFRVGLVFFAVLFLVGYIGLIARSDQLANKRSDGREIYRNQMGFDRPTGNRW